MLKLRRLMIAAVVVLSSFAGFAVTAAVPAGAFCSENEGCSPCGGGLIIDGKNTRIEFHQC